jgi:hypothetical protein
VHEIGGSVTAYDDHVLLRWCFHRWLDNARAAQRITAAEENAQLATIASVQFWKARLCRRTFLAFHEFVITLRTIGIRVATAHDLVLRQDAFKIWKGTALYLCEANGLMSLSSI